MMSKSESPTRSYVAVCNKPNFDGYYFKKFSIPGDHVCTGKSGCVVEGAPEHAQEFAAVHNIKNDAEYASWYFLNVLDSYACIEGCISLEDYQSISEAV